MFRLRAQTPGLRALRRAQTGFSRLTASLAGLGVLGDVVEAADCADCAEGESDERLHSGHAFTISRKSASPRAVFRPQPGGYENVPTSVPLRARGAGARGQACSSHAHAHARPQPARTPAHSALILRTGFPCRRVLLAFIRRLWSLL
jgi:hypothetical protein